MWLCTLLSHTYSGCNSNLTPKQTPAPPTWAPCTVTCPAHRGAPCTVTCPAHRGTMCCHLPRPQGHHVLSPAPPTGAPCTVTCPAHRGTMRRPHMHTAGHRMHSLAQLVLVGLVGEVLTELANTLHRAAHPSGPGRRAQALVPGEAGKAQR